MLIMTDKYPDCWIFDANRRVYNRNEDGIAIGGPIWKEHWRKVEIVDETKLSWITSSGLKIPKKGKRGICFSSEDIEKESYIHENRHKIADMISSCNDYDKLKTVAELIGYYEES
jgi:hypothetical protein